MRTIKILTIYMLFWINAIAQDNSQNYISIHSKIDSLGMSEMVDIQYFDGLGRPVQKTLKGYTPQGKDLVTKIEYDYCGRVTRNWLPTPFESESGFINLANYENSSKLYYQDERPYSENKYYAGSWYDKLIGQQVPGNDMGTHYKQTDKYANSQNQIKKFIIKNGFLEKSGYYDEKTLICNSVIDEDGISVFEYKDKQNRVVMKRNSTNVDTYYVYNDLEQLAYVLPPIAADSLTASGQINDDNGVLKRYGYLYKYDERGNCIYKRLPGCEPITMTYYPDGLIKTSQDGNQLAKNESLYYEYDNLRRLVRTSLVSSNSGTVVLTEYYYDNYNFIGAQSNLVFVPMSGYDGQYSSAKGLLTGTRTRILDNSNTYIYSATYYDYRGLAVQTRSTNHLGGYDFVYNAYDFTGHVTKNLKVHSIPGQAAVSELYDYVYDHAGRLMTTTYQLNDKTPVVLASNTYDNLGRLVAKQRHGGAESEEFRYNIRNWLTIHNYGCGFMEALGYITSPEASIYIKPCYNGNISSQTFGQLCTVQKDYYTYMYDNLNRLTFATGWTRNNSSIYFSGHNESYSYDKMGNVSSLYRSDVASAIDDLNFLYHGNKITCIFDKSGSRNSYTTKEYQDKNHVYYAPTEMVYDANGNLIRDLDRDILGIKYNYLNLPEVIQFKGGNQIRNLYDANGVKLNTRYIVLYCEIEVPVNATNNDVMDLDDLISYTEETYIDGTDYFGNIEWTYSGCFFDFAGYNEKWSLGRISNSEGYVNSINSNIYYYTRKDHLGNIREVWSPAYITKGIKGLNHHPAATVQRTQYYPSGLPWASNSGDNPAWQNKKFNGKEFIEMNGYDTYDYGARQYYPAIGRFTSVDPLAEQNYSFSPYAYCAGNPVNRIDPDGMDWAEVQSGKGKDIKKEIKWFKNKTAFEKSGEKGQYLGKAVVVFNGSKDEKLGSDGKLTGKEANPACVTVYGINGEDDVKSYKGLTMTSDRTKFSVLNDGWYDGKPDKMSGDRVFNYFSSVDKKNHIDTEPSLPYRLSQDGNTILEGTKNGNPIIMVGVFFHRTNTNGFAGIINGQAISEGCPVVNGANWRDVKKSLGTNITIKIGIFRK